MSGWINSISSFNPNWEAISAISTIAIAFFGYLINVRLNTASKKSERYSLLVGYRSEIFGFASEFFDVTAEAISECDKEPEKRSVQKIYEISARLSAHVDKGRFLFPNYISTVKIGEEKGPAFEGLRREPLDAILSTYFAVESLKIGCDSKKLLCNAHRVLVRAQQPVSPQFDPNSATSIIIEARRSFLNSVVPNTFPREWRLQFSELFGNQRPTTENELNAEMQRHLKLPQKPV
ncbi:hypothetical protein [Sulfitobacter sp.]|uniref:hypothetical protein n=1 Tax=Sulfitobacter sp. TaxID=1903071 RepID=UPI003EF77B9C